MTQLSELCYSSTEAPFREKEFCFLGRPILWCVAAEIQIRIIPNY